MEQDGEQVDQIGEDGEVSLSAGTDSPPSPRMRLPNSKAYSLSCTAPYSSSCVSSRSTRRHCWTRTRSSWFTSWTRIPAESPKESRKKGPAREALAVIALSLSRTILLNPINSDPQTRTRTHLYPIHVAEERELEASSFVRARRRLLPRRRISLFGRWCDANTTKRQGRPSKRATRVPQRGPAARDRG